MKKGVVTDGGLWEEGWGWLMIEVDPMGKGPTPEGYNHVSSNPLPACAQQTELQGDKSQRHLRPADQVGCPGYFGALGQVQIQRLD